METLKRKRNLVLLLLAMLPVIVSAQSKGLRLGAMFGEGRAKVESDDFLNQSGKLALGGGVVMSYQLTKNIGVYGNVLVVSKGTKCTGAELLTGPSGQFKYTYWKGLSFYAIEVPLMPKVSVRVNRFYIKAFAGPSINFNVHTNEDKIYDDAYYDTGHGYKDQKIDVPLLEYSIVWGGGIDAEISERDMLFLEFRKQEDLNMNAINIVNNNHYYNEYYLISVGYLMSF